MIITHSAALNLAALGLLAVSWIVLRIRLGRSPYHPWLGAVCAAIVSVLANALRTQLNVGPIADLATIAGALLAGFCFTLGVRAETRVDDGGLGPIVIGIAMTLALALVLELAVGDPVLRISVLRVVVALEFLAVFLWIPQSLRSSTPRLATGLLALLAGLIALGVLVQSIMTAVLFLSIVVLLLFTAQRSAVVRARR